MSKLDKALFTVDHELDGMLRPEETEVLHRQLRENAILRRQVAEMLVLEWQIPEVLEETRGQIGLH